MWGRLVDESREGSLSAGENTIRHTPPCTASTHTLVSVHGKDDFPHFARAPSKFQLCFVSRASIVSPNLPNSIARLREGLVV